MLSPYFAGLPLSFIDTSIYALPYQIAFICVCIAAIVILIKRRSLLEYWRKSSVLFYVAVMLILAVLLFQMYDVPRMSIVGYDLNVAGDRAIPDPINQVTLFCQNHGDRSAHFTLILSCVNASFQPQEGYVLVNNQTVRIEFFLKESWFSQASQSQTVNFSVMKNVAGFTFTVNVDQQDKVNFGSGTTNAAYNYNATQNCYLPGMSSGFIV